MRDLLPPTILRLLGYSQPFATRRVKPNVELRIALLTQLGLDLELATRLMEAGPMPHGFRYRHFTIPKRDGSVRELVEPGLRLKQVQRAIVELLGSQQSHCASIGFKRGLSIADHAWTHAGGAVIVAADIKNFFGSTHRWRVAKWWRMQGYTDDEALLLTRLTTYHNCLPQGAPTSPILSNLINIDLDTALDQITRQSAGVYTRYADDLAFSWPNSHGPPTYFEQAVRSQLNAFGYTLHPVKGWQLWRRQDEPMLTGLVLTKQGGVDLPKEMQKIMRTLAHSQHPHDQQRYIGYTAYRAMVDAKRRD